MPGAPVPEVAFVPPEGWAASSDYLYGCDLYNHAYWWEAHEAWEGLWQLTDKGGAQGRFLQGIIQVSACHLKRLVGHENGVKRLYQTSLEYLRSVTEAIGSREYMGLDVADFIRGFEAYYHAGRGRPVTAFEHDPRRYPYIRLREDTLRKSGT